MGVKIWATTYEEAAEMIQEMATEIGFIVSGRIELYDTEPQQPPRENPYGYDIQFTPFGD